MGVALVVAVLGLTLHLVLALEAGSTQRHRGPAARFGRPAADGGGGDGLRLPLGYGLVLWGLAIIHLVRRRLVTPVTPLLALPLLGLSSTAATGAT